MVNGWRDAASGTTVAVVTTAARTFQDLVREGESVPVEGWDFSWFAGRATEERPPWQYARLLGEAMANADSALDLQTGGGEVVAGIPRPPAVLVATESWPPNAALAGRALAPLGGTVVLCPDDGPLPFADASFDLVTSRHPTITAWPEIARVLRSGGQYLSQQIGAGSHRELYEFLMGPQPLGDARDPDRAADRARSCGLHVAELRTASLRVQFFDIAAVIVFLRKVIWTVPDFSVQRYRDRLRDLHAVIEQQGSFTSHAQRFLIRARKPRPA
jgi:SAM-dependent methyltransferase